MSQKILLIHGPNLNLLGKREPEKYGNTSMKDIERISQEHGSKHDATVSCYQSNHEGNLVDRIHEAQTQGIDFIIINAGAYTHTSIALRDALLSVEIPYIELHVSNVHSREAFRHKSFLADKAVGVVCGLGVFGYKASVEFATQYKK
ncbi:hypothetical protein BABINDRAFT_182285 [Babjeviella inositovora NRRL Y-12698]|uniref:Catabolic 3-dehydroquinase n=1 Tax=Babjeviella inositovora NRRL Y-12698 TaxID=984486 RepID=A0A1E3R0D0_9ASCO|nr:uncharacterized protein BABINDRAFT_182285 [Babjeviella inositovora NRRL Y-12698]ODQ83264.1 hypothetical protein BABINDRAFT_182285 [Babjeviella inositovora NRRL Y-12698]